MSAAIEFHQVYRHFGTLDVLQGLTCQVQPGEIFALLGRNGMGKTTTVHSITGFVSPKSGTIYFKGESITRLRSYQIVRKGLALVPQGRRIFTSLSVEENLIIGARKEKK